MDPGWDTAETSLPPLACKIVNWKSRVLCHVNVSCLFLLLVKRSFTERSTHVLMVQAARCECHEVLGTSLDPELCNRESSKGRWHPTELFEIGNRTKVATLNQTRIRSRNRSNHSLSALHFKDSRFDSSALTSAVNMYVSKYLQFKKPVYKMPVLIFHER